MTKVFCDSEEELKFKIFNKNLRNMTIVQPERIFLNGT